MSHCRSGFGTRVDQQLADKIVAWIGTADWPASKAYLEDNAATLLTDEAEATVEHLIDINPTADTLPEHRTAEGGPHVWRSRRLRRPPGTAPRRAAAPDPASSWLATRTWTASRAFATAHSGELLHLTTVAILDDLGEHDPADRILRLHRGLLAYAATAGFDVAYDLRSDTHPAAADAHRPGDPRRYPPGGRPACTAGKLTTIPKRTSSSPPRLCWRSSTSVPLAREAAAALDQTAPLAREAAAALADCASNAAPYEQRDFTHRLAQLGTEHPQLAPFTAGLQHILTNKPDATPPA